LIGTVFAETDTAVTAAVTAVPQINTAMRSYNKTTRQGITVSLKIFASVIFTAWLAIAATTAAAQTNPPAKIINLRAVAGGGQTLDAAIDGHAGAFLFDSGWGVSSVTPHYAELIGCKPWGKMFGFRATGERVDAERCNSAVLNLAGVALEMPTLGVIDLMKYMPKSVVTYAGALGLDAFDGRAITIRSRARQLILESPGSLAARVTRAHRVPIRLVRDVQGAALSADIGVPTASGMIWLELDTGNYGGTMIGRHVAQLVGLDPKAKGGQDLHMQIIPGITVAGRARIGDYIMDGNIGEDFLDQWDLTLDLSNGRGWLAPAE
jgi:hypothetical protein